MRVLVQTAPLAGFQYYAGKILWDEMREGDRLALVRETDNRHDPFAVRVELARHQAGLPARGDNRRWPPRWTGHAIAGRIGRLATDRNPWKRLRVDVYGWVSRASGAFQAPLAFPASGGDAAGARRLFSGHPNGSCRPHRPAIHRQRPDQAGALEFMADPSPPPSRR